MLVLLTVVFVWMTIHGRHISYIQPIDACPQVNSLLYGISDWLWKIASFAALVVMPSCLNSCRSCSINCFCSQPTNY